MLQATGIEKNYGELHILKGVDLQISAAEIISIVGSSGAGKTTLLQILGTLDTPTKGKLFIEGKNPFELNEKALAHFRNQRLGFVFQFHQLLPEFTAQENIAIPAMIGGKNQTDALKAALHLLDRFGLAKRAQHKPEALSGGEQQRIAVARALINDPALVFADEPSGNLDTENANALHQLFFQLREEMKQSFVIVTHNAEFAQMADRSLQMKDGQFV
ncbi:MAG: ABC transporter ATP-binding protein [Flavobacteriia bacterium]|jgi:lipoprotein-releasing system ATP-binding protein|nr:ABC transporter ATP-binding protein [Cryomorphaceae bacterium]